MLLYAYQPATLLKVTGEDAATYLQGQFTNELRQPAGAAVYGLWLNQKGKVLADSQVLKEGENEFRIVSPTSAVAVIRPRLEEYIVADDVTLTDETTQVHGLAVSGAQCGERLEAVLGAAPQAGRFVESGGISVFAGRRTRGENFELIGPAQPLSELKQKLLAAGAREASADEMEFARIADGMPAIPADIGLGDLPNEGGLEDAAISYTKGCYLGQEVMARLKNLGKVRRQLHIVQGTGPVPRALAPLYQGGKQVGQIRSNASRGQEFVALAMLSLIHLDRTGGLSLAADAAPALRMISHG